MVRLKIRKSADNFKCNKLVGFCRHDNLGVISYEADKKADKTPTETDKTDRNACLDADKKTSPFTGGVCRQASVGHSGKNS